jgi:hypothetical protein
MSTNVQNCARKPMAKFATQDYALETALLAESEPPSNLETASAMLATESDMLRRCRVNIDAARRDVAESAYITHTTLAEIEDGLNNNRTHRKNVRRALLRIAAEKGRLINEAIQELVA